MRREMTRGLIFLQQLHLITLTLSRKNLQTLYMNGMHSLLIDLPCKGMLGFNWLDPSTG